MRGLEEERPEIIKFKRNMDTGALLAVVSIKKKWDEIAQVVQKNKFSQHFLFLLQNRVYGRPRASAILIQT